MSRNEETPHDGRIIGSGDDDEKSDGVDESGSGQYLERDASKSTSSSKDVKKDKLEAANQEMYDEEYDCDFTVVRQPALDLRFEGSLLNTYYQFIRGRGED